MLELYQAEWCPASRHVRQRLTELRLDFIVRQVPLDREKRLRLLLKTGTDTIPVLVDRSRTITGEDAILAYLGEHFEEPQDAQGHREKAAVKHRGEILAELVCMLNATPVRGDKDGEQDGPELDDLGVRHHHEVRLEEADADRERLGLFILREHHVVDEPDRPGVSTR